MQTVDRQTMTLFEDLYKSNQKIFEEFACYFLKDSELAKDIVADCFVRSWMSRDRVALDNAVGYMFRSVRNACLDGLPEEKRRSFLLSNVDGLKYKEIAEMLNISEDKVDNNIRSVRKALKSSLKDYLPMILLTFISVR